MFRKNTASQFIHIQGVDSTTGGIKSGVTWTVRRCIDGTFAAGGGTVTEDGTAGWYKYAMAQADTNGNNIGFNFTGTGAIPQTVNIVTTAADPTNAATFGITDIDAAISSRMATYTQPTGFLAATFPTGTVANTTNITSASGVALTAAYDAAKTASQAGDAMTLTAAYDSAKTALTTAAQSESYRANGATGTVVQLLYEIAAHLGESSISGTTKTLKKLDHSTTAETYTLDSATTPSSVTRAT